MSIIFISTQCLFTLFLIAIHATIKPLLFKFDRGVYNFVLHGDGIDGVADGLAVGVRINNHM